MMKNRFGWALVLPHSLIFLAVVSQSGFFGVMGDPKKAENAIAYSLMLLWADIPSMIFAMILSEPVKRMSAVAFGPTFLLLLFFFSSLQWFGIGILVGKAWKKLNPRASI